MVTSSTPGQVLVDAIGNVLTEIGTRALRADPATLTRLRALSGKRITITSVTPPITWELTVTDQGIEVGSPGAAPPHVAVTGQPWDLLAWLSPSASFQDKGGDLTIDGDIALLEELHAILSQFSPDPAESLSKLLGEQNAATLIGTAELGLRTVQSIMEGIGRSFAENTKHRGSESSTRSANLDTVMDTMDDLRLRVDRLAARLAELEARNRDPDA